MAHIIIMPLLAETMDEGTIARWLAAEGAEIKRGQPLVEVETDKANMEVAATASGVLRRIVAPEGTTVPVNEPIAIIAAADEDLPDLSAAPAEETPAAPAASSRPEAVSAVPELEPASLTQAGDRLAISPRARKMAAEKGVEPAALAGLGTGPGGRIVERDVEAFAAARPSATPLAAKQAAERGLSLNQLAGTGPGGKIYSRDLVSDLSAGTGETIKLSGMRKVIADRLAQSAHTAVSVTLTSEVDMTAAVALRRRLLPEVEKAVGTRLTYTDIIFMAVSRTLAAMPLLNSTFENDEIRLHREVNPGLAVALEQGLVVPVVRRADTLGLAALSAAISDLAGKARKGELGPSDMSGGTFTVTNLGAFGVEAFTPVINPPQTAILGVGAILEKPAVVDGQIVPRSLMYLSLVFDHRVMDGAPAAIFLQRLKTLLEQPELMLL